MNNWPWVLVVIAIFAFYIVGMLVLVRKYGKNNAEPVKNNTPSVDRDYLQNYRRANPPLPIMSGRFQHRHMWRIFESQFAYAAVFYAFQCETCGKTEYVRKSYFWDGWPDYTSRHTLVASAKLMGMMESKTTYLEEALEAMRFTQEYAQLPCVDGWSWWDFYKKHRPDDAKRLKNEWEAFEKPAMEQIPFLHRAGNVSLWADFDSGNNGLPILWNNNND